MQDEDEGGYTGIKKPAGSLSYQFFILLSVDIYPIQKIMIIYGKFPHVLFLLFDKLRWLSPVMSKEKDY